MTIITRFNILSKFHRDCDLKLADIDTTFLSRDKDWLSVLHKMPHELHQLNIKDIKSYEIRNYYINQVPECFLNNPYGKFLKLSDVDTTLFKTNKQNETLSYKDVTVNIADITSDEIRKYCIKQIPECFLNTGRNVGSFLKLSDVDTTLFKINKQTQTLFYKDVTVNIKDITSDEIRKYCLNELKSADDKDICKYIIDTLQINNNTIKLNLELYLSLKSSQNKLYILKYVFSKYKSLTELQDKEELFKIFFESPSFLIDLLRQMISTNNNLGLEYILKHKNVSINRNDYKKLQDYSTNLHLFELTNTLTIYCSLDVMLDKVDVTDIDNSTVDELWS